jgi:hypothetical protein
MGVSAMLGHLVSTRAAPVLHAPAQGGWLRRLMALLFRRG